MISPVRNGILTSGYDEPRGAKIHGGYDIISKDFPAFSRAICDLKIIQAGWSDTFGFRVWAEPIDKELKDKYPFIVYAHHHKLMIKHNTEIREGELIGQIGNTGISKGSHLHIEARTEPTLNGKSIRIEELEAFFS